MHIHTLKGVPIESVRDFIYLGHMLSSSDEDWSDVHNNLVKARRERALISRVPRCAGAARRPSHCDDVLQGQCYDRPSLWIRNLGSDSEYAENS
jgi:hypothetical protein